MDMTLPGLELPDIKFLLIFTFFLYLYFRKKQVSFLRISVAGYISLFLTISLDLQKGMKALAMIAGLVAAFILSYKELDDLSNNNISAKEFLNPDVKDIMVLAAFIGIWMIIRNI